MKCSLGIAVLFAVGGFVSVLGDEHTPAEVSQPEPNGSIARSDVISTNERDVIETDASNEIDRAQQPIDSGNEAANVAQPSAAARPLDEAIQNNESDVELEMLKMINNRLRQEVEDKSRIIEMENQRSQIFMLLAGAVTLLVGGGIGFFFGFRLSKNDLRL